MRGSGRTPPDKRVAALAGRQFEDDRAKDAALVAAGYTVMRFTWRQLRDDPTPSPTASKPP